MLTDRQRGALLRESMRRVGHCAREVDYWHNVAGVLESLGGGRVSWVRVRSAARAIGQKAKVRPGGDMLEGLDHVGK